MSLNGNLNTLSFPDLLQLISSNKKTGVLTLMRQAQRKEIYFREGNIVFATSSNTEEELIGNLLIRLGKLSQAELDEVIKLHRATGQMIGATVVEMGLLKKEELVACLKLQIEEIVYNLFSWKEGEFIFQDDKEPAEGQITTNLNTMNVIMEGTRKIDEMVEMQKILPKDNMVLKGNSNPKIDSSSSVNLSLDEFKVLLMVDGEKTYPDILEESPLGEYSTSRALLKLIDQEMVVSGEKRQTRKDKRKEESALLEILVQVFSTSFSIIDKMLTQKLGKVQEKLWNRTLTQKQDSFPILSHLLKNGTLLQPRDFVMRLNNIPDEVRLHQISQGLQSLLSGYLTLAHDYLGEDITRQIATEIKKSTAPFLLKEREAVRKYGIEDDLFRTLKLALKGEESV
ncbi:MAG TPA: DUF4388 domain-containing protein [Terriglobales bacterium]|nr:DUF4388 domain-containing protein [Terriglobales bacterium]